MGTQPASTVIDRSSVIGNNVSAPTGSGGGLHNVSTSTGLATMVVTNSTISGNMAANGAGVSNDGSTAIIELNYATIAMNMADTDGGGILQKASGGTISLKNSIVADNAATTGPDISGTVVSQNYNHVENLSGATFTTLGNDVTGVDPQLGALAFNGGSTLTHQPAPSSPVVDSIPGGTSDCGTTVVVSQNGYARPQDLGCEKGSVETGEVLFRDGFDGI